MDEGRYCPQWASSSGLQRLPLEFMGHVGGVRSDSLQLGGGSDHIVSDWRLFHAGLQLRTRGATNNITLNPKWVSADRLGCIIPRHILLKFCHFVSQHTSHLATSISLNCDSLTAIVWQSVQHIVLRALRLRTPKLA